PITTTVCPASCGVLLMLSAYLRRLTRTRLVGRTHWTMVPTERATSSNAERSESSSSEAHPNGRCQRLRPRASTGSGTPVILIARSSRASAISRGAVLNERRVSGASHLNDERLRKQRFDEPARLGLRCRLRRRG